MKKQPSGWFIDPQTKEMIIIIKKKDESDAQARARVGADHKVEDSAIHAGPPPTGNPEPVTSWLIDLPDRPARPGADARLGSREAENPFGAVSRYDQRIAASEGQAPALPPISQSLLGGDVPMLGRPQTPGARSVPESEQKR